MIFFNYLLDDCRRYSFVDTWGQHLHSQNLDYFRCAHSDDTEMLSVIAWNCKKLSE